MKIENWAFVNESLWIKCTAKAKDNHFDDKRHAMVNRYHFPKGISKLHKIIKLVLSSSNQYL